MAATVKGVDHTQSGLKMNLGIWSDSVRVHVVGATGPTGDYDAIAAVQAYDVLQYAYGAYSTKNTTMQASSYSIAEADQANGAYTVQVDFTHFVNSVNPNQTSNANLLNLPAQASWSWSFYEEVCDIDKFGNAIINSAGDPFDPPDTIEKPEGVLTLTKYMRGYNAVYWGEMQGKLNSADVVIPGLGKATKRTVQLLTVTPATSYLPTIVVPISYTAGGPFPIGAQVTYGSDGSGTVAAVNGTTSVVLTNVEVNVTSGDTLDDGAGNTATATANVAVPPIQLVFRIRYRPESFDRKKLDAGYNGWYTTTGTDHKKDRILMNTRHETAIPIHLIDGSPAVFADYVSHDTKFSAWLTHSQLATRVTADQVTRTHSTDTNQDFLSFQRIDDVDFNDFGLN